MMAGDAKDREEPMAGEGRGMRLARFMASAGIGSRRRCEEYIAEGRVTVNGEPEQRLSRVVDPSVDEVRFEGRVLRSSEHDYIMLNKPVGYVCTARDEHAPRTVFELLPETLGRLFYVGRLDRDSEGLLLFTNDGELSHCLTHPSRQVEKTYVVDAEGAMTSATERRFLEGVEDDGETLRARRVRVLRSRPGQVLLEVVLCEGRKREVRRMCAACGLHVVRLARVSFGGVELGRLPTGGWRRLTPAEVASLREAAR